MTTYETPEQEVAALRALIASIRSLSSWHYDDQDLLYTSEVRDLIDDEADDDENIWVLGTDHGEVWSLQVPTEASAVAVAAGEDRDLRPMTRAEAKRLGAAYRVVREVEDEKWRREAAEADAAREEARLAAEAHAKANPRYIENFDFFADE